MNQTLDSRAGSPAGYAHVQRSPLAVVFYALAAVMLVSALCFAGQSEVVVPLGVGCLALALIAAALHQLSIWDAGDRLRISFGPLPLLGRGVRYDEIRDARVDRTTVLDGWGVHYSARGGWVWNIWGRDCVRVELRRGVLWLGSDDAPNLAAFLQQKIAAGGHAPRG